MQTHRQQSELHYRAIFENTGTATAILGENGTVCLVNHEFETLSGYRRAEVEGQMRWSDFVAPEEQERIESFRRLRRNEPAAAPRNYEFRFVDRRGRKKEIFATAALIDGTDLSIVSCLDFTERKQTDRVLRETKRRLQTLSRSLLEIQETERRRIARELHDEIGQELTVIKMNLQVAQRMTDHFVMGEQIRESIGIVERALRNVRDLALALRPAILDDLGLVPTLRWYIRRLENSVSFRLRFDPEPNLPKYSTAIETACFRIAQEALTNAARHADPSHVLVGLYPQDDSLILRVEDDGAGFDVEAALARAARGESFGLLGMRERVVLAGGDIRILSCSGKGTSICASFPTKELAG